MDEHLSPTSYLSVFITHFLASPMENSGILRKLYIGNNLSQLEISLISKWPRTSIADALKKHNITKLKKGE